jgi:uncharacterized protein (DUF362 family)
MATVVEASTFQFVAPPQLAWAQRILIKAHASTGLPYPVSTSPWLIEAIINGVRKVTDAEVLIADGSPTGASLYPMFEELHYKFNRTLLLDVKDSIFLEMENPLQEFFASPTFHVPNLVLRSDYLISVAPYHVHVKNGRFSIANLLGLLPVNQKRTGATPDYLGLRGLDMERVLADLYFTLPFDMGIVEARQRWDYENDPTKGHATDCGKILVGDPFEVDVLAARLYGTMPEHLSLIDQGRRALVEA